jgi:dTDP-4-amino-4,6-dideoxygalactose transaminase
VLRVKLQRLDDWNAHRRRCAEQYFRELADCPALDLPAVPHHALPVWHQFVIRVRERDLVREELASRGIETLIHYPIQPHRSVTYTYAYPEPLPITEQLAASVLSLPISPHLNKDACARVCEALLASVAALGGHT